MPTLEHTVVVSLVARKFTWHYKVFRSQKPQKSVFTVLVRQIHTYRHHLATTVHGVTILIQIMLRLMKSAQVSIPELRCGMQRFICNTGAYELIVENCLAILCVLQTTKLKSANFNISYFLSTTFNLNHHQFIFYGLNFFFSYNSSTLCLRSCALRILHVWHNRGHSVLRYTLCWSQKCITTFTIPNSRDIIIFLSFVQWNAIWNLP